MVFGLMIMVAVDLAADALSGMWSMSMEMATFVLDGVAVTGKWDESEL